MARNALDRDNVVRDRMTIHLSGVLYLCEESLSPRLDVVK
jgi:hypothetical protein